MPKPESKPEHLSQIQAQLLAAWKTSELTLEQVIERSGLELAISSLSRKLKGELILTAEEIDELARVFKVKVTAGREQRAS